MTGLPVPVGTVVGGKYRVERLIGAGGMAVVALARHVQLGSRVAIKFLLSSLCESSEAVARFAREARAAARLSGEHVVRVLDIGDLETGTPYMVMEYLDGADLDAWLRHLGPLPVDQAVEFLLQACVAVAEAHGHGIVHRDLKPANLFCIRRADGLLAIKVLDFGISKLSILLSDDTDESITQTSAFLGSPMYMSPEQLQTPKEVDGRTDIWALGVTLYELLSGKSPFDAASIGDVAFKITAGEPVPLRELRPEVPADLEPVVARCLAKDRRERYGHIAELARDLANFAPGAVASADRCSRIVRASGFVMNETGEAWVNRRNRRRTTMAAPLVTAVRRRQ